RGARGRRRRRRRRRGGRALRWRSRRGWGRPLDTHGSRSRRLVEVDEDEVRGRALLPTRTCARRRVGIERGQPGSAAFRVGTAAVSIVPLVQELQLLDRLVLSTSLDQLVGEHLPNFVLLGRE